MTEAVDPEMVWKSRVCLVAPANCSAQLVAGTRRFEWPALAWGLPQQRVVRLALGYLQQFSFDGGWDCHRAQ